MITFLHKKTNLNSEFSEIFRHVWQSEIGAELDCSFGYIWEDASGQSFNVPSGEHWAIYYRPVYEKYDVTIRKYIHMDGQVIPAESYSGLVTRFAGWDFRPTEL